MTRTIIRTFDGSLADAQGLLAVEQATFDESPYSAEQVRAMLSSGVQHTWLALAGDEVAGFVIAFATHGLRGPSWEIDLLAVHPDWRGHRLGTRLIRAASAQGVEVARQARAVVATDNPASARAFARAGFRSTATCELLIYRADEHTARPQPTPGVSVHQAADPAELAGWLPKDADLSGAPVLLCAEGDDRLGGYVELLRVETLLYRGLWIESLVAGTQAVRTALVHAALDRAVTDGLDEVGNLLPAGDRPLLVALLNAGFRSLGEFHLLTTRLPLPGLAASLRAGARPTRSDV